MTNHPFVLRRLLLAGAAVAVLVPLGAGSASADGTLSGAGTAASPYLIGSDADLDTALQMINADTAHTGASTADYKLTADLDYSQDASNTTGATTANWKGIDWFSGTFDGDGHTISNMTYVTDSLVATGLPASTAPAGSDLGLFRILDRATVTNLTLQGVRANATASNSAVGGVAVWSFASTVSGVEVTGSTIGPAAGGGASWVGGLVALAYANEYADRGTTVTDGLSSTFTNNQVVGGAVSDANRTGGIVGMATGPTTVADNYVNTTLSNGVHPVAGLGGQSDRDFYVVGGLVGEVGATYTAAGGAPADGVSITDNAIDGTIRGLAFNGAPDHQSENGQNFASATVGYATTSTYTPTTSAPLASNWSTSNNLVGSDFQFVNVTGPGLPGVDGTSVSPATLATEATYTGTAAGQTDATTSSTYDQLGWNTAAGALRPWTWTGTAPVLEASAGLAVATTTVIAPVGSTPSDASLLSDAGATTTSGTATIDTSDVRFGTAGSYQATIGATGGYAKPVTVTVVVYTPGTVILANPAVDIAETSTDPSEADVLGALGALLPPGASGPLTVDLTGAVSGDQAVQWSRRGDYRVTVSDTNASDGLTPATATITVTRAGVTTVTLTDSTPTFQATSSAPDEAAVLRAMGANVVNGDGDPTVDLTGAVGGDQAVNFNQPGEYQVTVSDTVAEDSAPPVTAIVKVVAVSVVSADSTVYFNTSNPPTSASLLSAAGAKVTDGAGNTVNGTLSASVPAGCGATAGSCTATITGTDMYGFTVAPVTVTVNVSAAAVTVTHPTATFTSTGSAPSQAALANAFGATVTGSTNGGTPAVDTSHVNWDVPGSYPVTVGDSAAHDAVEPVRATIQVVPVPFVTVPNATVFLPLSAANPLSATTLLANAGATLTDTFGNAIDGTLSADTSGVNGTVAGTYTATITGTDSFGFASSPVRVTVVVYLSAQLPGTVSITGTAAVGSTLTANPSGWAALADPSFQWLRNGVEIPGATGSSYTVTAADAGAALAVRMTESPQWYSTASATSDTVMVAAAPPNQGGDHGQTPPVTTPPVTVPATIAPKVSSTSYRSGSVRLKAKVMAKGTLTVSVTMKSGKKTITLGTHKVSVKKAGTVSTAVTLSKSAKSRIKHGAVHATVTIAFKPSAKGGKTVSSHKALTIKKAAA